MIISHLDEIIKKRNTSYYMVSKATGISGQNLKNIATNNTNRIYYSTLDKLCRFLDCSIPDLIELVDDPPDTEDI